MNPGNWQELKVVMYVIRLAVLIAIIALVMPRDPESTDRFMAQIDQVSTWAQTSCDRNAQTCQIADAVWNRVSTNAQYSAALIVDSARAKLKNEDIDPSSSVHIAGKAGAPSDAEAAGSHKPVDAIGTLLGSDLRPDWRGTAD